MIRLAEERDTEGITRLLYQVAQVHADGRPDLFKSGGIKYTKDELREILKASQSKPIYVYDADGQVQGYVFCSYEYTEETTCVHPKKSMYIDDLCVDEKLRGGHIGRRLFDYACAAAREADCDSITLHVWECNPNARKFYEHIGMQPLFTAMEYSMK